MKAAANPWRYSRHLQYERTPQKFDYQNRLFYTGNVVHVPVKVKLPFLWGRAVFKKSEWSQINLVVGPNGSGKTLLMEAVSRQFSVHGYTTKFLHSERGSDREALAVLETNEAVRQKIQTVLSGMFGKTIVFKENGGKFIPVVENRAWNVEYNLEEVECHGLREIITLLVALYANTGNTCLVFDEPELHLHPQFQQFFAEELRRVSKRHPKRIYFVITHSPFFIDLRFPEELLGVVVCHTNREPTHLNSLHKKDGELFRRFLPRFNTYHKQFFFSDNQIFVEGYTDQQIFSCLLPYVHGGAGAAGTGIIDVGGKDELGVFCKVCALLGTDSRIITDLDSLFGGKLRDVFCADSRARAWLEKQYEKQLPFYNQIFSVRELSHEITLEKLIARLERYLVAAGKALCALNGIPGLPEPLASLVQKLDGLREKHVQAENIDTFKTVVLQGICIDGCFQELLRDYLPPVIFQTLPFVRNLFSLVLAGAGAASVYILPAGCIEHYYTQSRVEFMPVAGKDRLFHAEMDHLLSCTDEEVKSDYGALLGILESACSR